MGIMTLIRDFSFEGMPRLLFGPGSLSRLPELVSNSGTRVLLITGWEWFQESGRCESLIAALRSSGLEVFRFRVRGEPAPSTVYYATREFGDAGIDAVVAVGGGAVIDAAKAISAMLPLKQPVKPYLEGVGTRKHPGVKKPLIAVPTTAGTGAEATKNAVLSEIGPEGFKKSLRHNHFIPDVALLDPDLTLDCPREVTAACGMDALTQLIESYVSTGATPLTDALAWEGLKSIVPNLIEVCSEGSCSPERRGRMLYGSFLSGVTLAHAGLGVVHGFASPIGGLFEIPHGIVCGTLLSPCTRVTVGNLLRSPEDGTGTIGKYARIGRLFSGTPDQSSDDACRSLVGTLQEWTDLLRIPKLGQFGVDEVNLEPIVQGTALKNNPARLTREQLLEILRERL